MSDILDFYLKHSYDDFLKEVDKIHFQNDDEKKEFIRRIQVKPHPEYKNI